MSQTVLEPKRRRLPTRQCSLCGQSRDVLHLIRMRELWLCAPCYHERVAAARPEPPAPVSRLADEDSGASAAANRMWALRTADRLVRCGTVVLKLALYGILWAVSQNAAVGPPMLAGFFLADGLTWLGAAIYDWHFHRRAVIAEVALYGGLVLLWLAYGFELPAAPEDRAVLALTALGTVVVKVGVKMSRIITGSDDGV